MTHWGPSLAPPSSPQPHQGRDKCDSLRSISSSTWREPSQDSVGCDGGAASPKSGRAVRRCLLTEKVAARRTVSLTSSLQPKERKRHGLVFRRWLTARFGRERRKQYSESKKASLLIYCSLKAPRNQYGMTGNAAGHDTKWTPLRAGLTESFQGLLRSISYRRRLFIHELTRWGSR